MNLKRIMTSTDSTTKWNSNYKIWWGVFLLLIYDIMMFHFPLFHFQALIGGNDMTIFLPYKVYWINSLKNRTPALWNPYASMGEPFLACPSIGAYSIFNLFYFIFNPAYATTLTYFFSLGLAALGVYVFLIEKGCMWECGILGGIAYAFGAYPLAQMVTGEYALVCALPWIPWTLYFWDKGLNQKNKTLFGLAAASCAWTLFQGYPQIALYLLMACAWWIFCFWISRKITLKQAIQNGLLFVIFFFVLAACQILPSYQFVIHTNRWHMSYWSCMTDYLAPINLWHFIEPNFLGSVCTNTWHGRWGYQSLVNYIGIIPLILFLIGIFLFKKIPQLLWLWGMAILALLLSMGSSTPLSSLIFQIFYHWFPGFSKNRVLGRMMIITDFSMVLGAGLVFNYIFQYSSDQKPQSFLIWKKWIARILLIGTVLDLVHFGRPFFKATLLNTTHHLFYVTDPLFPQPMFQKVLHDPTFPRVDPANRVCANMYYHLSQRSSPDTCFLSEMGIFIEGPTKLGNDPLLDLINLKYSAYPNDFGFKKKEGPNFWVNQKTDPRTFIASGYQIVKGGILATKNALLSPRFQARKIILLTHHPKFLGDSNPAIDGKARIVNYRDNEVSIRYWAPRAGLLFLSDPYFPGWKASIDGKSTKIFRADGAFRAVVVPAGHHLVTMKYQPKWVYIGLLISAIGWIVFLGILGINFYNKKQIKLIEQTPMETH
jgi:hypothetical protein